MNSVNIIGRLGADIELKHTPGGKPVAEANLAVDDGWGEHKKTVWLGVTIWGIAAELAAKALRKGDRVGFTGRLSQEEWEGKDGKKQRKTKVTCEAMHLLGDKREGQQPAPKSQQPAEMRRHEQAKADAFKPVDDEDDIPF